MDYDFDRQDKWKKKKKLIIKIVVWVFSVVAVIAAAFFTVKYSMLKTNMAGNSMEPTLQNDDTIIVNKLSYFRSGPERFDVIVYRTSESEHEFYTIKRVIGLPGETVQIMGGAVYINGKLLEEPMNVEPMKIAGLASNKLLLDDDEYFVLGDNRNSSEDSRFANIGNVIKDDIIGKAFIRTNGFGFVNKFNMKEESEENSEEEAGK